MDCRKIITFCVGAILLLGLVACTPTLDGSSEEAYNASYEEVINAVPEKDKLRVKAAFAAFKAKKTLEATLEGTFSPDEVSKKILAAMDGKTANDILKLTGQSEIKEDEK
ncbi:DUF6694 family lipoprotein [Halodesulfovibrio sp.]|uniref:DUF6694 family lipoprotein n=1 Tax=Halodesulfovibrio sp. TaxID=1912772 RepID=UPI0025BAA2E2|nr:DUF6694 family lipoprotein [Halodesulfovibrio sp.]